MGHAHRGDEGFLPQGRACGSIDNAAGDFTPRQNAAMWRFRDWLIKNFDAREKDGFYLLDAGINTDNEHGFRLASGATAIPFEKCPGEEKLRVQAGNPHPYPNYPAMGLPFAAFIQYHRLRDGLLHPVSADRSFARGQHGGDAFVFGGGRGF